MPYSQKATEKDEERRQLLIEMQQQLGLTNLEMARFLDLSKNGYQRLKTGRGPVRSCYVMAVRYLLGGSATPDAPQEDEQATVVAEDGNGNRWMIAALRVAAGLTQAQMATAIGMSLRAYNALETGESEAKTYHRMAVERVLTIIGREPPYREPLVPENEKSD